MTKSTLQSIAVALTAGCLAVGAASCSKFKDEKRAAASTTTSGTVVMACDETFQKVMEQEIDVFEYQYPEATIMCRYLPENEVIDSIVHGENTRLAITTRELDADQIRYLEARKRTPRTTRIAVDAIAIIANPENPVECLTIDDLSQILAGKITQWGKVEPGNKSGDIKVVFDYEGSSTVNYMTDSVMHGQAFGSNVYAQNDNARVFATVAATRGALGIIGVSWVSGDLSKAEMSIEQLSRSLEVNDTTNIQFTTDVKVLAIAKDDISRGYKPYQAYIYDGSYPLFRSVYMTATGGGGTLAGGFYSFVTGFAGQKLIQTTGVLPGAISPRIVQVE